MYEFMMKQNIEGFYKVWIKNNLQENPIHNNAQETWKCILIYRFNTHITNSSTHFSVMYETY